MNERCLAVIMVECTRLLVSTMLFMCKCILDASPNGGLREQYVQLEEREQRGDCLDVLIHKWF